jgi:hypothetical protein
MPHSPAVRQVAIKVDPRPSLRVGDRVKFADEKQRWTVRAVTTGGRFVILTKPFNLQRTVLYTVVDFDRGVRGRDNYYGLGYETPEDIDQALHEFQHTEDQARQAIVTRCDNNPDERAFFCRGGAEVSHRSSNHIRLDFEAINGVPCDPFGGIA